MTGLFGGTDTDTLDRLFDDAVINGYNGYTAWYVGSVYTYVCSVFTQMEARQNARYPKSITWNRARKQCTLCNGAVIEFRSSENVYTLYGLDINKAVVDEQTMCNRDAWRAIKNALLRST